MTELHNAIKQAIQRQDRSGLEATEAATRRVIKVLHSLGLRKITGQGILVGCEIICIGEQRTDLIACPLPVKEQLRCFGHRQFEAGFCDAERFYTS